MNQIQQQLLLYLLFIASTYLPAQKFVAGVHHYGIEEGLSHREVHTTCQASDGFIWVGTSYGLNRFDGHSFRVFTKEKHGLSDNRVGIILEDKEAWLWIMSQPPIYANQVSFLNIHTYEVENMQERFGEDCPLLGHQLSGIVAGPDKKIYLSLQNRIYQVDGSRIKRFYEHDGDNIKVTGITAKHHILGVLEQSGQKTFIELDTLGNPVWSYQISPDVGKGYVNFFEDGQGNKWLFGQADILHLPPGEKTPRTFTLSALSKKLVNQYPFNSPLYASPDANYHWYLEGDQLFVFSLSGGMFFDIGSQYPEVIKNGIINIDFDHENNAWISTPFGFYRIQFTQSPFHNYLELPAQDYQIDEAFSSRGMIIQDGKLRVNSAFSRRYAIELASGKITQLNKPQDRKGIFVPLHIAAQGGYYSGSDKLLVHAKEEEKVLATYHWRKSTDPKAIWSIHQDQQQKVWLGLLSHGLGVLENDSLRLFNQYNSYQPLKSSSVYHFLQWDDTHTLISSTSGIYVLHATDGIIQQFSTAGEEGAYIPSDLINHIHRDQDEPANIWAATGGGGLLKLQLKTQTHAPPSMTKDFEVLTYEQFTTAEGLSHNTLYATYEDDYQNLWISSDYGINQFNKTTQLVHTYTTDDGLPFDEFNRISHLQDQDGRIFFGSMNGIASFIPENTSAAKQKEEGAPLVITEYQQFDGHTKKLVDRTLELIRDHKITLQPDDQFFTLKFALLEYIDPTLVRYSYKIDKQGADWINLDDNRLRISGLPYGNFQLQIRARGVSGQFSSNQLAIAIQVVRPFYIQQGFIFLMVFLLAILVVLIDRVRTRILRRRQVELEKTVAVRTAKIESDKKVIEQQAEELRQLDMMKSRFYANISHELRTPLTLILAPVDDMLSQKKLSISFNKNLRLIQKNSELLQKKVNEILDLSKLEAGKLTLATKTIHWQQFLRVYIANFDYLASAKKITFTKKIDVEDALSIEIDVPKMEMVLGNLLSNAFKFTPRGGTIAFMAKEEPHRLHLQIKDTGQGIHPKDVDHIFNRFYQSSLKDARITGGTGIGLAIVKEFIQLMEGEITVDSQLGVGTTFTISLPKTIASSSFGTIEAPSVNYTTIPEETASLPHITTLLPPRQKPTILLVEDHVDLQQFIQDLLSPDYHIITAFNGEEALAHLAKTATEQRQVDLVLSDIMMPVMDGYQLLKILKSDYSTLPVVILTARGVLQDKLKALRIGVDDYLTKPFSPVELQLRIAYLLKNAQTRKQAIKEIPQDSPEAYILPEASDALLMKEDKLQAWLAKLEEKARQNCSNPAYTIGQLASDLNIGKRQLERRTKIAVGLTPGQYLKVIRLTKARELLASGASTSVKAAALVAGYKDVAYFSKAFQKEFGKRPSEFLAS